jgi:3-deoxy-D-manno-octulosonic-acid transferase
LRILVTTTTPSGADHAQRQFGASVEHAYFPFDTPGSVSRALNRIQPSLVLLMETELWPNLLHACAARQIPAMLINARLSARALERYRRVRPLVRQMLAQLRAAAVQTQSDADRLIDLGLSRTKLRVTGSIKFDQALPVDIAEQVQVRRQSCAAPRPIWIAASTHAGEESTVLAAQMQVLQQLPQALLLLAPRHPTRADEVVGLIQSLQLRMARRSPGEQCDAATQVYLLDTLGELLPFYGAADAAFVGGSMVPAGGHNMLEPAALGVPVLFGPQIFNFENIGSLLTDSGAAVSVNDVDSLAAEVLKLLNDEKLRRQRGAAALAVVQGNAGALTAAMKMIEQTMDGVIAETSLHSNRA